MTYYDAALKALWLVWAVYWIVNAWGNKRTVRRVSPGARLLTFILLFGLFLAFHLYPGTFERHLYARTVPVEIAGISVCASGVAIAIWARRTLGKNWSGSPTVKEDHELIQAGPYRLVRHPIYTGILLMVAGTGLCYGKVREAFLFLFIFVMFWIRLKIEESFMCQQFPEAYPEYRNSTKALIPYFL
jgi:protein-S-isoprenylcysteine O-methyltransferase Ste14